MLTYKPTLGQPIDKAVNNMISMAIQHDIAVRATFNDIHLEVTPNSTTSEICHYFCKKQEERLSEYQKTEEYQRQLRYNERQKRTKQYETDQLMEELSQLDFSSMRDVLQWIKCLQESTDFVGVRFSAETVLRAFTENGFRTNENCGVEFEKNNAENVARWIIGQTMSFLSVSSLIHPVISSFVQDWLQKFARDWLQKFKEDAK